MNDKYMQESPTTSLVFWITGQMLKGAGIAFLLILAVSVVLGIIWGISKALPDASKTMPSPYNSSLIVAAVVAEA